MIGPATTLREIAFLVCTALHNQGDTAVLTGGGAATVYAPEAYQSRDLDFIFSFWSSLGAVSENALLELGFERRGDNYHHPVTTYTLDFPRGPLAVGNEQIGTWETLKEDDKILHILTPTDSVPDRLCAFFFWNDFSALEQALAIARRHPIDLESIKAWSKAEGESGKFEAFLARLSHPEGGDTP